LHDGARLSANILEGMSNKVTLLIQELDAQNIKNDKVQLIIKKANELLEDLRNEDFKIRESIKELLILEDELRELIEQEQQDRHEEITIAINTEAEARQRQIDELNNEIQTTNHVLEGVHTTTLTGDMLTRIIGGTTLVARNLFDIETIFIAGKTLINDIDGTIGVYIGDSDAAFINVMTKTISPVGLGESINLGVVQTNVDLPLTITEAVNIFGRTPRVDDYATVQIDETMQNRRVEWYITAIDAQGNITWGNPVPINTGDYQQQSAAEDAGRVLIGGANPGTFGASIPIEIEPTQSSNNLVSSGGIFAWFGAALSTLKTGAKTLIGAVNELFDSTVKLIGNQTIGGTKTFTTIPVLPSSNPTIANQAVRKEYVDHISHTFVIDSNTKLNQWATNASGFNYSRVLIKAGTWTYDMGVITSDRIAIDISNGRTRSVDGEAGSKIVIRATSAIVGDIALQGIAGRSDIIFKGVTLETSLSGRNGQIYLYGFASCSNLYNCKSDTIINVTAGGSDSDAYSYGFAFCRNLFNCEGSVLYIGSMINSLYLAGFGDCSLLYACAGVNLSSVGFSFYNCRTGFGCRGIGNTLATRTFFDCFMEQRTGTTQWANTAAGGYNYNLTNI
jgi:hypothetical protein